MKKESKKRMKVNKGITLIALVVTIVVLLILAGITIVTLFGENGIISAAQRAADDTAKAQVNTENGISSLEGQMADAMDSSGLMNLVKANSFVTAAQGNQIISDRTGKTMIVPVGFKIASDSANEIDKGVVIEDKEHNQYVWVPVSDSQFNDMFGSTVSGSTRNYFGKLYNFTTTEKGKPMNSTIGSGSGCREPDIVTDYDGTDSTYTAVMGSMTADQFKAELQTKFNEMAKSVQKYKGFYIGRYEASSLNTSNPKTVKGADPNTRYNMTEINWYNMYKNMQGVEKYANSGVQSDVKTNMIWGCQWDRTLDWIATTDTKIGYAGLKNSTSWGNYKDATFEYTTTSGSTTTALTKAKDSSTAIQTGSTERNKANNIYDLVGNLYEWTMEARSTYVRTLRGGSCGTSGSSHPASVHVDCTPDGSLNKTGSRPTLYVKVP